MTSWLRFDDVFEILSCSGSAEYLLQYFDNAEKTYRASSFSQVVSWFPFASKASAEVAGGALLELLEP